VGGESVGVSYIIGAEIYGEAPSGRGFGPFDSVRAVFVRVGKPVPASVGFDNLPKGEGVHLFTLSGKVSGYIHPPKLAFWEPCDCLGESFYVGASGAYLVPI
jgi:hypothetical protein